MVTLLNADCRFRFAPSPTGTLHVGGARTALFNWLLARKCGGKFILRIEDTDRERSTEESVQAILDGMRWLGLDWDEGPFFQSKRADRYQAAIVLLLDSDKAYPCFCSTERLDALRKEAKADGRGFVYDGLCRRIDPAEAKQRIDQREAHTIRFKTTPESLTTFQDMIGGPRSFENDRVGDFILRRTDGSPIYHLTVVVDDHEMGITHVVRGDDHLANTPRQILIFEALGWKAPLYGHLPLIQGSDRARLSKRHGATGLMDYAADGFLPEAMINYLALLGWSLDAEAQLFTRQELVEKFSIERINNSAAIFDRTKLEWMNGVYLRKMPLDEVTGLARRYFLQGGVQEEQLRDPWFGDLVALVVERSKTLAEMRENLSYFFASEIESYEPKAVKKHFLREGSEELLAKLEEELSLVRSFELEDLETCLRAFVEREGLSFGKAIHPLRLALTGRSASPGIFDVLKALGRSRSVERIFKARKWIERRRVASSSDAEGTT